MRQKIRSCPGYVILKFFSMLLGLSLFGTALTSLSLGQLHYAEGGFQPGAAGGFLHNLSASGETFSEGQNALAGDGDDTVNILLIGQDRRENEGRTRSDTMILCSFNKRTKKLTMASFLRDLYVPIPGYGSDRLNSAYVFGGMELLDRTIEEDFGVRVDGNVEVDFSQFTEVVDTLGGVELDIRADEAEVINFEAGSNISAGVNRLNGLQALAYARIRKLDADGDFSRTSRQRKVLDALLTAYRSASIPTMLALTTKILPMITTDMTPLEIVGHSMAIFPYLSSAEVVSLHIPVSGTFSDQNIDGMAVLVPDLPANRDILREALAEN